MRNLLLGLIIMLPMLCACSTRHKPEKKTNVDHSGYSIPSNETSVSKMLEKWPAPSQAAAKSMMDKYGIPALISNEMFIWYHTGPFKRTVVSSEDVAHSFPLPHSDVLQQTISYRVPMDKTRALSELDGSLLVDRTKGELTARSDKEEMNFLVINLADQVVRGDMDVTEARQEYARSAYAFSSGMTNRNLTGINFKLEGDTRDPDQQFLQAQEDVEAVERTMKKKN